MGPILFLNRCNRHERVVIHALAERFTLPLAHSDHAIKPAVNPYFLVNRIHAGYQIIHDIRPNYDDGRVVTYIAIVDHAAGNEIDIKNWHHRGRHAANHGIVDGLLAIFDVSSVISKRGAHPFAMLAGLKDGFVVFHSEVLALLAIQEFIDVGDGWRILEDDEDVGAKIENLRGYVAVDAIDEGDHGDYGGDSDYHPKQGQRRAEFVRP